MSKVKNGKWKMVDGKWKDIILQKLHRGPFGGEFGLNYLCAGYKIFFNHINPYMKFMGNEPLNKRPPANVIYWAKEKDKGFPDLKISRNDFYPCRSGKKFKNCCSR